jgi:predicted signal transduction protein with EAL and GGDEF domain
VESEAVADWLTSAACDHAQGYYFARPEPWADLVRRVSNPADSGRALQPTHRAGPAPAEGSST